MENLGKLVRNDFCNILMSKHKMSGGDVEIVKWVVSIVMNEALTAYVIAGNLYPAMDLFNGKIELTHTNPIAIAVREKFAPTLMSKLDGIDREAADAVADLIVPFMMEKYSSRATGIADNTRIFSTMSGISDDDEVNRIVYYTFAGKK